MLGFAKNASIVIAILVIVGLSIWGGLALWYRLPFPELFRALAAFCFVAFGLAATIALAGYLPLRLTAIFVLAFAILLVWWSTIKPPAQADWSADVDRQVTGTINGNLLTLTNVRDFQWRGETDFTERWETKTYDLDKVRSVDLFLSYWAGPEMAHGIISFGFEDGRYLAWSAEVRRRKGGEFSPVADLFKSNPLVLVAAEERDVIGVRSNIRNEDVQLYRLNVPPAQARRLLLEYIDDANELAKEPVFFNSLTTNCTTTIVKMVSAVGDRAPLDWRLVANGYLSNYAYDHGALDRRLPFSQIKKESHIRERALDGGLSSDFSRRIREGVHDPLRAVTHVRPVIVETVMLLRTRRGYNKAGAKNHAAL